MGVIFRHRVGAVLQQLAGFGAGEALHGIRSRHAGLGTFALEELVYLSDSGNRVTSGSTRIHDFCMHNRQAFTQPWSIAARLSMRFRSRSNSSDISCEYSTGSDANSHIRTSENMAQWICDRAATCRINDGISFAQNRPGFIKSFLE